MCTVTWHHSEQGYDVLCNRDELRTRMPALPPQIRERCGVRYVAPMDGDAGGAWIGANEFGICLALLNYYDATHVATGTHYNSRGGLLVSLLDATLQAEVTHRLQRQNLDCYAPFILLVFSSDRAVSLSIWEGKDLTHESIDTSHMPITTSSFAGRQVVAHRRQCLQQLKSRQKDFSVEQLLAFHRSHNPSAGAYSVCMHREDALTVSFSHVHVRSAQIEFRYHAGSPCQHGAAVVTRLDRRP